MKKLPVASSVFAALSIIWFIYMTLVYGTTTDTLLLYENGAIYGKFFTFQEWWRLISPIFVHIGFDHLLANMFLLLTVGRILEYIIGSIKFSILYLFSGILGNLAVVFFAPNSVTAGASGALYGILGFLAIHAIFRHSDYIYFLGKSYLSIIAINVVYTFVMPGISIAGHLGGFVAGMILGIFITENKYEEKYEEELNTDK